MTESLTLGCDLRFADLHGRDGLVRLDGHFVRDRGKLPQELAQGVSGTARSMGASTDGLYNSLVTLGGLAPFTGSLSK